MGIFSTVGVDTAVKEPSLMYSETGSYTESARGHPIIKEAARGSQRSNMHQGSRRRTQKALLVRTHSHQQIAESGRLRPGGAAS